ncbi:hypothetical protein, partial [Rhodanobacter sp. 115]|uniref:hypothetical protein n=1 Tax=Rhodanobacter sp. FW021-MT20 TaxID=1162282 RepID=UPI001ED8CB47
ASEPAIDHANASESPPQASHPSITSERAKARLRRATYRPRQNEQKPAAGEQPMRKHLPKTIKHIQSSILVSIATPSGTPTFPVD